jgi:phosphatidyl-myo-inositol alpha-mannosyltransferase
VRIAQVCPYDIDRPGGVQVHIRDLATALRELGHEVTVLAPRLGPARPDATPAVRLGAARRITFGGTSFEVTLALGADRRALVDLLGPGRFDVVHYHTIWSPFLPLQAFVASSSARVATFHETTPHDLVGRLTRVVYRRLARWLLPRLDAAIAVSDAPLEYLPRERTEVLPPCTDLRRFAGAHAPFAEYRDGRVNLLCLGRLEERKGVFVLLRAYRRLCADGLPVRLLLAGDGELRPALRRFAVDERLPHVVFAGAFADADAPRWYATCDVFCAPALYGESFGIVLTEAMASGRAVVAAANPGYRTVLAGDAARCLVPPADDAALYAALRRLVIDAAERQRQAAWGSAAAMQYDSRTVAPRFVEIYERAVALRLRKATSAGSSAPGRHAPGR